MPRFGPLIACTGERDERSRQAPSNSRQQNAIEKRTVAPGMTGPCSITPRRLGDSTSWPTTPLVSSSEFTGERRFQAATLFVGLTTTVFLGLKVLAPSFSSRLDLPSAKPYTVAVCLGTLILYALQRLKVRHAASMLTAAVFEVATAFSLSMLEVSSMKAGTGPTIGVSAVTFWIAFFGVFVAMSPGMALAASAGAALSFPIAVLLAGRAGMQPLQASVWIPWASPGFLMALWTWWVSRRVFGLARQLGQAKEIGSYHLVEKIGQGGMGEVWRATHRHLARAAAIKLIRTPLHLPGETAKFNEGRLRLEREAQAIARLSSPHTIQLFDFGVTAEGQFYYVMELLDRLDLDELVRKHGPQPPERVVSILQQACRSLAEAHHVGIVHRDIKPSNLILCRLGVEVDFLKVVDFGLVKDAGSDLPNITAAGETLGTPAYAAPEQISGNAVDGRTDIYSLGCVAFFLLTGRAVFVRNTAMGTAVAHLGEAPERPSAASELSLSTELDELILRCLEKDPEKRPESALDLETLLGACPEAGRWTRARAEQWWRLHRAADPASAEPLGAAESRR